MILSDLFCVNFIFEGNLKVKLVCAGFVKRHFSLLLKYLREYKMKLI